MNQSTEYWDHWDAAGALSPASAEQDTHPDYNACQSPECAPCGVRDCPSGRPDHYSADGCPECSAPAEPRPESYWPVARRVAEDGGAK